MRAGAPLAVLALGLAAAVAAPVQGQATEERLTLPSGLQARLQGTLRDRTGNGLVQRFRFVAAQFRSDGADIDTLAADLEYLCREYALPRLANIGPQPSRIVVSLADRASEFGTLDPGVDQVFEVFSVRDGTCMWEMF